MYNDTSSLLKPLPVSNNKKLISYDQWEHHTTDANAVDHLAQKFPGGPLNSRRFPGFPGVVDTL